MAPRLCLPGSGPLGPRPPLPTWFFCVALSSGSQGSSALPPARGAGRGAVSLTFLVAPNLGDGVRHPLESGSLPVTAAHSSRHGGWRRGREPHPEPGETQHRERSPSPSPSRQVSPARVSSNLCEGDNDKTQCKALTRIKQQHKYELSSALTSTKNFFL